MLLWHVHKLFRCCEKMLPSLIPTRPVAAAAVASSTLAVAPSTPTLAAPTLAWPPIAPKRCQHSIKSWPNAHMPIIQQLSRFSLAQQPSHPDGHHAVLCPWSGCKQLCHWRC